MPTVTYIEWNLLFMLRTTHQGRAFIWCKVFRLLRRRMDTTVNSVVRAHCSIKKNTLLTKTPKNQKIRISCKFLRMLMNEWIDEWMAKLLPESKYLFHNLEMDVGCFACWPFVDCGLFQMKSI